MWNFSADAKQRISDTATRDYIASLIKANVMRNRPIQNIGVIQIGESQSFHPLSLKHRRLAREFRLVLFLCAVANRNVYQGENAGHSMITSDNCSLVTQNFQIGSRWTAYSIGSIVRIQAGGEEVAKTNYEAPRYILNHRVDPDEKFMKKLAKIKRKNQKFYRTILRATDAFMGSYFNSDDISLESKVLQQARAFEVLLDLPERKQRKVFSERIDDLCSPKKSKKLRYKIETAPGKFKFEIGTKQKMWADRFFTLRNHIIHGQDASAEKLRFGRQMHQDLALWFFLAAIKKLAHQALGEDDAFCDEVKYERDGFEYDKSKGYARILYGEFQKIKAKKRY